MNKIIIAGIHTDVGKTVVSAIVAQALDAHYWKPVQCGIPSDTDWMQQHLKDRCLPSAFSLKTPCSPHLAAKMEGICIHSHDLQPPKHEGYLVIEGVGGIMAPLNEKEVCLDAFVDWPALWICVHRHYLGSLNHFFLTVEALKNRNIALLGVIFNGEADRATETMLLNKAQTRELGRLTWETDLTATRINQIADKWRPTLLQALGA